MGLGSCLSKQQSAAQQQPILYTALCCVESGVEVAAGASKVTWQHINDKVAGRTDGPHD